jgi:1,4-dihydroxy-2-naphthoyl-CoA hydrolase
VLLGVKLNRVDADRVEATLDVTDAHMAPIGYLHAGTVVTLADTACGYGCLAALPAAATGFTTIELKCNHLATAGPGQQLACTATPAHLGRTTQVWDAIVTTGVDRKPIAIFRCTQLVLYPPAR